MKKIETSKLILIVSYIIAIVLTCIVVVGTFMDLDISNVTSITLASWVEVSASNVWYLKKAGRENVIKIYNSLPQEVKEQVDINQMLYQQ